MVLSKRYRDLAWEGLGWSVAAGLAIALIVTVAFGLANERSLEARIAAAEARSQVAARTLSVCQATSATLKNALTVAQTHASDASGADIGLTPDALLARRAVGVDACARAYEAEALVREAAR